MSLALYRKYRPSDFDEVVGQEHVVRTLRNAIKSERVAHAYLFSGPRGTGKTSIARILAKAVNCTQPKNGEPCNECANCRDIAGGQFLDLVEIDAATHTQVDKMRELIERINFSPAKGKKKVYIIDEVHMLSKGAFNALLKTLEEPPAHVLFILATTEIHKIPATIISRCQRFDFRHLRVGEIKERLGEIARTEKVEVEDGVLEFIALSSGGGMRDSESLFGQIIALEDGQKITLKEVRDILSLPDVSLAVDIVRLVLDKRYAEAVEYVDRLAEEGSDLNELNKGIVENLRKLLLLKMSPGMREQFTSSLTEEQIAELENLAQRVNLAKIFKVISAFIKSQASIKGALLPQLPLEMAIAEVRLADNDELTPGALGEYNGQVAEAPAPQAKKKEEPQPAAKPQAAKAVREEPVAEVIPQPPVVDPLVAAAIAEPEEAPAPSGDAPAGNLATFQEVKDEWEEIVLDMRQCNNSLTACLKTCQPLLINERGEVVVACQYPFYRDKLQKPENRVAVEQVASEAVKAQVKIKFIGKEEAQQLGFEMEEIHSEEKHAEDLVNSALDMFGGEVVA